MSKILGFEKKTNSSKKEFWESKDLHTIVLLEKIGDYWYLLVVEQHKEVIDDCLKDYSKLKSKAIKYMKSQSKDIIKIRKYKEARKW